MTFDIPSLASVVTLNLPALGCVGAYACIVALGIVQVAKLVKFQLDKKERVSV